MAHFAEISLDKKVLRVIVVPNSKTADSAGVEREEIGAAYCKRLFGGTWKQTSYNRRIRKHFASVGYTFDSYLDAFIPPKTFPSWTLNTDTCMWESPVPYPEDGKKYDWDEATQSWIESVE